MENNLLPGHPEVDLRQQQQPLLQHTYLGPESREPVTTLVILAGFLLLLCAIAFN